MVLKIDLNNKIVLDIPNMKRGVKMGYWEEKLEKIDKIILNKKREYIEKHGKEPHYIKAPWVLATDLEDCGIAIQMAGEKIPKDFKIVITKYHGMVLCETDSIKRFKDIELF